MNPITYAAYVRILKKELVPALGCTEPIAVAFAAAKAREVLGCTPDRLKVRCSGNIIKNVKGVTVPNSHGMYGIAPAATLGAVGGDASRELEVLSGITDEDIEKANALLAQNWCDCELAHGVENLFIQVFAFHGETQVCVEICSQHTHITRIEKNGELLFEQKPIAGKEGQDDKQYLNVRDIITFAEEADLKDVSEVLDRQIRMNTAIAQEGLRNTERKSDAP